MSIPVAPGTAAYNSGSSSKFIPEVWSGKLVEKFYETTVFNEIANTDYEGEIKDHGDKVIIRTVPDITIRDYVKGQDLIYDEPESPAVELNIDHGKVFAFKAHDVDKKQSDIKYVDSWSQDGSDRMKIKVDSDILATIPADAHAQNRGDAAGLKSQDINLGTSAAPLLVNKNNILDVLVDFATVLDEQNVPDSNRWVVLPPRICGLIKKSDLKDASITGDGQSILRNGRIGMIDRFKIYSSNNVNVASSKFDIVFGHKSALTFAGQITEMESLRNPNQFGDLIRSLFVFGYETIKSESLGSSVMQIGS